MSYLSWASESLAAPSVGQNLVGRSTVLASEAAASSEAVASGPFDSSRSSGPSAGPSVGRYSTVAAASAGPSDSFVPFAAVAFAAGHSTVAVVAASGSFASVAFAAADRSIVVGPAVVTAAGPNHSVEAVAAADHSTVVGLAAVAFAGRSTVVVDRSRSVVVVAADQNQSVAETVGPNRFAAAGVAVAGLRSRFEPAALIVGPNHSVAAAVEIGSCLHPRQQRDLGFEAALRPNCTCCFVPFPSQGKSGVI